MKTYSLSVEVGYELRSVTLTEEELRQVRVGMPLSREIVEPYEGEMFTYLFQFNIDPMNQLVITYDGEGVGFLGSIDDAYIEEVTR
jgi:hypothetical protein